MFDQPVQLSLMPRALGELKAEQRLVGLWLGGERWLSSGDRLVAAFVFFHLKEGGEAVVSIRSDQARLPSKAYGRWWVEGRELVVALGHGHIRGRYHVEGNVLTWADEVLMRRTMSSRDTPAPVTVTTAPGPRSPVRLQFELE